MNKHKAFNQKCIKTQQRALKYDSIKISTGWS